MHAAKASAITASATLEGSIIDCGEQFTLSIKGQYSTVER